MAKNNDKNKNTEQKTPGQKPDPKAGLAEVKPSDFASTATSNPSDIYPTNNPIDKGYGVKPPTKAKQKNLRLSQYRGGKLERLFLYATDFEIGAEMAGETAQSANVQQMFPSNFVQPNIAITGIARNSFEYNQLANFVRLSHHYALNGSDRERTVQMILSNGHRGFPYKGQRENGRQITKGKHQEWEVLGYIQTVRAGGKAHDFAPIYQFIFTILEVKKNGMWESFDKIVQGSTIEDWMANFQGLTAKQIQKTFVQQPEPAKKPEKKQQQQKKQDVQYGPWKKGYGWSTDQGDTVITDSGVTDGLDVGF